MSLDQISLSLLSRTQSRQVQDPFAVDEFVNEVMSLSKISILYHCPHTQQRLIQIYFAFCEQMNTQKMSRQDVRKFIMVQKDQNRKIISSEIKYYQQQFTKKVNESRIVLSKIQFQKIINKASEKFLEERNISTIITDIFQKKSKLSEFFSCIKILDILKEIDNEIEEYREPSLSPQKIVQKRRISQSQPSLMFDQVAMALMNDPRTKLQNYFSHWRKIVSFLTEFILDDFARGEAESLLQKFIIHQADIQDEFKFLLEKNQQVERQCREIQDAFQRMRLQKLIYQQASIDYKNRIYQLNDLVAKIEKQNKQNVEKNNQMQTQITFIVQELRKMQNQCGQMETQLKDEKKRYQELQKEYYKIAQEKHLKSAIEKKPVIFQERTLKQKLDDAEHRLKRFEAEKEIVIEKLQEKDNTIQLLLAKVAQLSAEIDNNSKKTEELKDYRQPSKIYHFTNSMISRRNSNASDRNTSLIMRGSNITSSAYKMNKILQQVNNPNRKTNLCLEQEEQHRATNLQRIKSMNIAADDLPQIQEENTNGLESNLLPPEQQLIQVIQKDKSSIVLQDKSFLKKDSAVKVQHAESTLPSKFEDPSIPEHFMSKGVLINVFGVKYTVTILLTHKRFCYFDIKLRLVRYLPIQNIKSFVFCKQNQTLFVIRPKQTSSSNAKTHLVNPMIFSIRNRDRFAQFLTTKASKLIKQNQIELFTKFEDDIFLNIDGKQINVKHKVPKMENPYRLALSDQPVFYAKLQLEGLLTFKDNAIIVIQPMGLVCFKGDETEQLQEKQQLLYFLPFNECIISQRENSREAPGRKLKLIYQKQSKYFNLIFYYKEQLKQFIQKCNQQKSKNKNAKAVINQNLDAMFKK